MKKLSSEGIFLEQVQLQIKNEFQSWILDKVVEIQKEEE